MPRPKRAKVAPSAPTAIPFLERAKAGALNVQLSEKQDATISKGSGNARDFDDLYDVSDKENKRPTRSSVKQIGSRASVQNTPSTLSASRRGFDSHLSRQNSHTRRNPQATPLADSSVLSLVGFKRRPRKPSIVGIGQLDDTPSLSSLGGYSDELDDDDELEGFHPQDESTPLTTRTNPRAAPGLSSVRSVKHTSATLPGSAVLSRKRKLTPRAAHTGLPQPQISNVIQVPSSPMEDFDPETSSDEPTLPTPRNHGAHPAVEVWDEVMALPESNSSTQEPTEIVASPTSAQRTETQRTAGTRSTLRGSKVGPLSTVALQNLLPRRRHGKSSNLDAAVDETLELSSEAENEDELSFAPGRQRKTKKKANTAQAHKNKQAKSNAAINSRTQERSKVAQADTASQGLGAPRRTYGRRSTNSEDQNDSLVALDHDSTFVPVESHDDTTTSIGLPKQARVELRKISQKFQEVDQWQMDFEDVSGRSSSPALGS